MGCVNKQIVQIELRVMVWHPLGRWLHQRARAQSCRHQTLGVALQQRVGPTTVAGCQHRRSGRGTLIPASCEPPARGTAETERHQGEDRRDNGQDCDDHSGGTTRGLPSSSTATKMKVASVTFSISVVWKRCAQASILMVMEVRPTRSTSV